MRKRFRYPRPLRQIDPDWFHRRIGSWREIIHYPTLAARLGRAAQMGLLRSLSPHERDEMVREFLSLEIPEDHDSITLVGLATTVNYLAKIVNTPETIVDLYRLKNDLVFRAIAASDKNGISIRWGVRVEDDMVAIQFTCIDSRNGAPFLVAFHLPIDTTSVYAPSLLREQRRAIFNPPHNPRTAFVSFRKRRS